MSDNNDKPQYHGLLGLIKYGLDFVTTPWKAIWLIFVGILVGVGIYIWEERVYLREYIYTRQQPTALRNDAELLLAINDIFTASRSTGVSGVAIWSFNIGSNRMEARVGRRSDGANWEKRPAVAPWIHPSVNTEMLTKLLYGQPACNDPHYWAPPEQQSTGGVIAQFLVTDGMNWTCFIPEPPSTVEPPVGLVILAWRDPPSDIQARSAVAAVLSLTARIITGGRFVMFH